MDEDGNPNFDGWQMKDKLWIMRNKCTPKVLLLVFLFGLVFCCFAG